MLVIIFTLNVSFMWVKRRRALWLTAWAQMRTVCFHTYPPAFSLLQLSCARSPLQMPHAGARNAAGSFSRASQSLSCHPMCRRVQGPTESWSLTWESCRIWSTSPTHVGDGAVRPRNPAFSRSPKGEPTSRWCLYSFQSLICTPLASLRDVGCSDAGWGMWDAGTQPSELNPPHFPLPQLQPQPTRAAPPRSRGKQRAQLSCASAGGKTAIPSLKLSLKIYIYVHPKIRSKYEVLSPFFVQFPPPYQCNWWSLAHPKSWLAAISLVVEVCLWGEFLPPVSRWQFAASGLTVCVALL